MLKEVQVAPGPGGEVVSRTGLATLRTGVKTASLGFDMEVQAMR
jgi:hypothetical protein